MFDIEKMQKSVEVVDGHILLGKPLQIVKFPKDKRGQIIQNKPMIFTIRQLNWWNEWDNFTLQLGIFLIHYYQVVQALNLQNNLNDLKVFAENVERTLKAGELISKEDSKKAWEALCKVCEFSGVQTKWMKKHFSLDDWLEIFMYLYLYNIEGKKKTLHKALQVIGQARFHYQKPKPRYTNTAKQN